MNPPTSPPQHPFPAAAPPQFPPKLLEFMEATLRAPFTPNPVFEAYHDLPLPSFGTMAVNLLLYSAAAALINLMQVYNSLPATFNVGLLPVVLALGGSLVAALALSFIFGGVIHLLALLSGGEAPYDRSYELFSLLSLLGPLYCATLWAPVPFLWLLPTFYGTFLVIRGVTLMHRAPETQACVVVGALGVALAAGQILVHQTAAQYQRQFEMWANTSSTAAGAPGANTPDSSLPLQAPGNPLSAQGQPPAANPWAQTAADAQDLAKQAQSSVDMVRGLGSEGSAPGMPMMPRLGSLPTPEQTQQLRDKSLGMLDNVSRQLHGNPALTKDMTPQQQEQMQKILGFVDQVRSQARTPGAPKPNTQQMLLQVMQMMSAIQQQPAKQQQAGPGTGADEQPKPRSKRRRAAPEEAPPLPDDSAKDAAP